ncbi:ABC transporter permease [Jidongwangia harbinensis]|uniref:ABC transporter permease n=1 Tax=Jidongwangia harbinensis TaxID=2878561 RepID=UPI001CD9CCE4|nr:ABC-2 family transporter protein [Jidongwangia harbinensis]MCA2216672.1 ABC-2 family transporter protein [Jidongwangia harbinensis]
MREAAALARIYLRMLLGYVRAVLEYRTDALILVLASVLTQLAGIVFLTTVFAQVPALGDWQRWEVIWIFAMVVLAEGIGSLCFEGTWHLALYINLGGLDYLMVRPYPVALQVMGSTLGPNGFSNAVLGLALLGVAATRVDVDWGPVTVGWAVLLMLSGVLVKLAISLASNTTAFWLRSPSSSPAGTVHTLGDLARYPITVYSTGVRAVLVVIPLAFVGYFPAASLFGKGTAGTIGAFTPLVAAACIAGAWAYFRAGMRRYDSVGN